MTSDTLIASGLASTPSSWTELPHGRAFLRAHNRLRGQRADVVQLGNPTDSMKTRAGTGSGHRRRTWLTS